eukprot:291179_1
MSKLFRAASAGKLNKLKQILKTTPLMVNQFNRDGYTALSIAISSQQYEIIEYLLNDEDMQSIIDINAGNNDITPMFVALNTNNQDIAIQLLEHNANPNTLCPNHTPIIHYAIQSNYWHLIQKLFQNPSFNYKIMTPNFENIFHLIVDLEELQLLTDIIRLIPNKQDITQMMNAMNNAGHSPLWKAVKQDQLNMTQIILDPDCGNADINCICCHHQTIAHLIYDLDPSKTGPFHALLTQYNADLTISDSNGLTPVLIAEMEQQKQTENDLEEQLLMQETMRLREKLKSARVAPKKHDETLNAWINAHDLMGSSFSNALLRKNMNWKQLMALSEDQMYEMIETHCDDMEHTMIQSVLNEWNCAQLEYVAHRTRTKQKAKKSKKKKKQVCVDEKIEEKPESKLVCNKYVKQFLGDFGLLELEFIFAKEKMEMTRVAEINNTWILKHIVGDSNHVNHLKMRLKMAVSELRKEIVREMRLKIKKDYKDKHGEKAKQKKRNQLRKRLHNIHPWLARLEEILSDPLYLLLFGFIIFVLFTFVLFVVVGPQNNST